jgi:hypothetical protein
VGNGTKEISLEQTTVRNPEIKDAKLVHSIVQMTCSFLYQAGLIALRRYITCPRQS